jgi:DNA repair protein RecO (recombination protein O)
MHQIRHTKAFVLRSYQSREADRLISLFTEEFGLIRAVAAGVRYEKSKLRFSLQEFSFSEISLVHGRGGWRITGANQIKNFYEPAKKETSALIARTFLLLSRLLAGEEPNEELFEIVDNAIKYVSGTDFDASDKDKVFDVECIIVLRILNNLGYVGSNKNLNFYTIGNSLNNKFVEDMKKERQIALREINRALHDSQL